MKIKVEEQFDGVRLDKFLSAILVDRTRAFLQKLVKGGHILVNGNEVLKSGRVLRAGDEILVEIPVLKEIKAMPEKIDLDILYEDDDVIVVNKPSGMVVHPSDSGSHMKGTLVNAILYHCKDGLSGISGEKRPGIVHRLDKDTSGVMVVAKTDVAQQSLMKQFKDRKVGKKYTTLVKGRVDPLEAVIDSPIGRSLRNRKKMAIVGEGAGRVAITEYKVRDILNDRAGEYSLIDIGLKTGRTHQIRVHMNAIGYPVVGDITYGDPSVNKRFFVKYGLKRQFLHAAELSFTHPSTGKELAFKAELPDELEKVIEYL